MKPSILIVDLNHLIHRYGYSYFNGYNSIEVSVGKIESLIIKLKKITNSEYVTIVGDLSCPSRKEYFNELFNIEVNEAGYKDGREKKEEWEKMNNLTIETLSKKYPVVRAYNYEADDIVTAIVEKLNDNFKKYIITIDADLLPLVDENTSVYMFRQKEIPGIESVEKYYLFDIQNFNTRVSTLKAFKANGITLNNFLLVKMLIGDQADNIPRVDKFTSSNIKEFLKWTPIDKSFKWSYFESESRIEEELKKIIANPSIVEQALRNFKVMKMNTTLGNRREAFLVKKEYFLIPGDYKND